MNKAFYVILNDGDTFSNMFGAELAWLTEDQVNNGVDVDGERFDVWDGEDFPEDQRGSLEDIVEYARESLLYGVNPREHLFKIGPILGFTDEELDHLNTYGVLPLEDEE